MKIPPPQRREAKSEFALSLTEERIQMLNPYSDYIFWVWRRRKKYTADQAANGRIWFYRAIHNV